MDTIWAGPKELGCPANDPDKILKQFFKILKPGGDIYLAFWTSQKFLPGFPLLEAKLNTSDSANAPFIEKMNPYVHIMNGKKWLKKANFDCIQAKSFIYDINSPLNDDDQKALALLFQMLWGKASDHLSRKEWEIFTALTNPDSKKFLPGDPDYYAFFTYTLFHGIKK
jgi:demethylmenaquinone methyltransferase/2-methoxy-6-polyprenyl-1,4-benzoquinol methylase